MAQNKRQSNIQSEAGPGEREPDGNRGRGHNDITHTLDEAFRVAAKLVEDGRAEKSPTKVVQGTTGYVKLFMNNAFYNHNIDKQNMAYEQIAAYLKDDVHGDDDAVRKKLASLKANITGHDLYNVDPITRDAQRKENVDQMILDHLTPIVRREFASRGTRHAQMNRDILSQAIGHLRATGRFDKLLLRIGLGPVEEIEPSVLQELERDYGGDRLDRWVTGQPSGKEAAAQEQRLKDLSESGPEA